MNLAIVLLGISSNAAASVLVKYAMYARPDARTAAMFSSAMLSAPLILGMLLYAAAFVLYAIALARMPLNVVHPILTSGAIAVVAVLSNLVFREPLPPTSIIGILLVIVGVILIAARISSA